MDKSQFPSYLRQASRGITQARLAARTGLSTSVVSRLFKGEQNPTFEHLLRLSVVLDIHPALLFEAAGREDGAEICRSLIPQQQSGAWQLCRRVQKLVRRGDAQRVDAELGNIELLWEVNRDPFEGLARKSGCESACLVGSHQVEDDVIYRWKCSEGQADELARSRKGKGWRRYSGSAEAVELDLFLLGGKVNRRQTESTVGYWAAVFRSALSRRPGSA